jgi:cell division protein FtsW
MKKTIDMPFLLVLCAVVFAGLLIFTSAALSLLEQDGGATFTSVAVSQLLLGLLCGAGALVFFARVDYRLWRRYVIYFFAFAVVLAILTFVPHIGLSLKGASRWLSLGPLSFQPVEILKFASVMLLAALYSSHMRGVSTFTYGTLPLLLVAGSAGIILLLQPDTANAVIVGVAAVSVYFAAGGRVSHILILALIGVLAIGGAAYRYTHVAERLKTFIDQESDPLGAGYQVQQSLIAIGSGGFAGRGFGQSIEKFSYLPEPIGDSIFAVAAEEFGFIGSTLLVLLYLSIALLGLRIAARSPDPFGGLLTVGIVTLIVGQSLLNISSAIGLVPLIGVPLIFVSHGGTALAISLAEVGVILNVSKRMRQK